MGLLVDTALKGAQKRPPIWLMRQAGRYMPEYRAVRKNYNFIEMCHKSEVACEVTMQPIDILDVDAAILFCDILTPLMPMGFDLDFCEGVGPVISNPVRDLAAVENVIVPDAKKVYEYVYEALSMIRKRLTPSKDLIGFAGAPFTTASYAIEGGSSKQYLEIKKMMLLQPKAFKLLMEKIAEMTAQYLMHQIRAGADAVQLFDSWGGVLSREDYLEFSHPYSKYIIETVKKQFPRTPFIHFVKGANGYFEQLMDSKADVLGCDWTMPMDTAAAITKGQRVLQGNLDPVSLFSSPDVLAKKVDAALAEGKAAKGHIFNLGHGIQPKTPVENVKFVVDRVLRS